MWTFTPCCSQPHFLKLPALRSVSSPLLVSSAERRSSAFCFSSARACFSLSSSASRSWVVAWWTPLSSCADRSDWGLSPLPVYLAIFFVLGPLERPLSRISILSSSVSRARRRPQALASSSAQFRSNSLALATRLSMSFSNRLIVSPLRLRSGFLHLHGHLKYLASHAVYQARCASMLCSLQLNLFTETVHGSVKLCNFLLHAPQSGFGNL
jgi:hypothetical protein